MQNDRRNFLRTSLGGLAGLASVPVLGPLAGCAATPGGAPSATSRAPALAAQPLAGRVSLITGTPGNTVVLASADGAVVVDGGSAERATAVLRTLRGERVRTLFNTHYHADQAGANAAFAKAGAEIRAHAITKQWLAADYYVPADDRWVKAPPKEAVPTVTFRDRGGLLAGGERIEYGYLLEAHTRGDAWVFFRDSDVLAVGDVASPERDPVHDWFAGGWLGGRVDAMDDLLKLAGEATRIVPAYGPVLTRAQLQAERDLMAKLYDRTTALTAKGHSAQDMLQAGALENIGRSFQDPYKFLYDVAKGLQAHYTNFAGNVV